MVLFAPSFKVKKGMRVNVYGSIYKVIAVKQNGNLSLKFLHFDAEEAAKWEKKVK